MPRTDGKSLCDVVRHVLDAQGIASSAMQLGGVVGVV